MGFSVSASTAIVFAGLFLAFGIFYPAAVNGYERVTEAQAVSTDAALNEKNSDIAIDSGNTNVAGNTLTVTVDNTGSTTLYVDEVDLLVEGEYIQRSSFDNIAVDGDDTTNLWTPGDPLVIEYTDNTVSTGNQITVATDHGIKETEVL